MILKRFTTKVVVTILMVLFIGFTVFKYIGFTNREDMLIQHLDGKDDQVVGEKMLKIRNLIYDRCVSQDNGSVRNVYTYAPKYMAYCPVAKVGSTFWKRVFIFLHNETVADNPFEISRYFTHYGALKNMKKYGFDVNTRPSFSNMTRFMFVRDPYTRLWAAYLDKFVLPDFWISNGRNIVSKRKDKAKSKSVICSHDITFVEFLRHILGIKPSTLNEHWSPIQYMCNPCDFRPHLVGKMETFLQDYKYIAKYFDIENIFPTQGSNSQTEEELRTLIDYNFRLLKIKGIRQCLSNKDLALRLWKVFEFNGYLPFKSNQSLDGVKNFTSDIFTDIVLKTRYSAEHKSRREWKKNRQVALKNAYKSLPDDIIRGLQKLFNLDFQFFDYDPKPPHQRLR